MGSPPDQRHYEPPNAEALESEFPGWHVWQGVNYLWYARLPGTSPPVMVRGEDLLDLRDSIIGWLWQQEARTDGRT